jgi:hypothetical protein
MESFWCKIMFKDVISHFRKLDDKAIVKDIKETMDALEDLNENGNSFGAMMVRNSKLRIEENRDKRAEAGRKGGFAKAAKNKKNAEVENASTEEFTQQDISVTPQRSDVRASGRTRRKFRAPSTEELYDFCCDNGLDEADARDCFEMCSERGWKDQNGKQIVDWKKFVTGFCESRQHKRSA